jgi:hypothetical protein
MKMGSVMWYSIDSGHGESPSPIDEPVDEPSGPEIVRQGRHVRVRALRSLGSLTAVFCSAKCGIRHTVVLCMGLLNVELHAIDCAVTGLVQVRLQSCTIRRWRADLLVVAFRVRFRKRTAVILLQSSDFSTSFVISSSSPDLPSSCIRTSPLTTWHSDSPKAPSHSPQSVQSTSAPMDKIDLDQAPSKGESEHEETLPVVQTDYTVPGTRPTLLGQAHWCVSGI